MTSTFNYHDKTILDYFSVADSVQFIPDPDSDPRIRFLYLVPVQVEVKTRQDNGIKNVSAQNKKEVLRKQNWYAIFLPSLNIN